MSNYSDQTIMRDNGSSAAAAGEDLSAKVGQLVYLNSSGNYVLADGASEDRGALGNGDMGGIVVDGGVDTNSRVAIGVGVVRALAGGAIVAGDQITGGTESAKIVAAATGSDIPLGRALTAASAADDWVWIWYTGPADEAV